MKYILSQFIILTTKQYVIQNFTRVITEQYYGTPLWPKPNQIVWKQEAQLLLGNRATRKHGKDSWNGRGNDNLG